MALKRIAVWIVVAAFLVTIGGLGLEATWAQEETPLSATLSAGDPTLVAKGVAVTTPILYSCTAASGVTINVAHLTVQVRQAIQKKVIATGFGFTSFVPVCDGSLHSFEVTVFTSDLPFRKGVALVLANLEVYGTDPSGGEYGNNVAAFAGATQEVRIK